MKKATSLILQSLFFLHVLLAFLLLFESNVKVPFWVQPLGRMHPLILHFPIAFVGLLVLLNLAKKSFEEVIYKKLKFQLLVITAFTTVIATIMGFLLSLEGYESDLMQLHKWFGVSLTFFIYGLVYIQTKKIYTPSLYLGFVLVILVGHYGAGLTHGSNFITEPLEIAEEIPESASVYQKHIQPIINAKCKSCHNGDKAKGNLDMSSFAAIQKGGKRGPLWIANDATNSSFIKRVLLPLNHKKHMAPEGKPQMTKEEIELVSEWISHGINDTIQYANLEDSSTLKNIITQKWLNKKAEKVYEFDFIDDEILTDLQNEPYISINPLSATSPALMATVLGGSKYNPEDLKKLLKVKEQLVSLNLSNLPVTDEDVINLKEFKNLEHLWLNFTKVTSKGIQELTNLVGLKTLSAAGTSIDNGSLGVIKNLSSLETLCVWDTNIEDESLNKLLSALPDLKLEKGIEETAEISAATPPKAVSKANLINTGDVFYLKNLDADAVIRYAINGKVKPDSEIYKKGIPIDFKDKKSLRIQAKAFKEGNKPSSPLNMTLYKRGVKPNSLEMAFPNYGADYFGDGKDLLVDDYLPYKKARGYGWVNYNHYLRLEAIADFTGKKESLKELQINAATFYMNSKNEVDYAEVYGADDKENWKLIDKITYPKSKLFVGKYNVNLKLKNTSYNYYKVVVQPGKGRRFYTSQLFFY